jgi:hypothetical protein
MTTTFLWLALLQADAAGAIAKTRAEASYEVTFSGQGRIPGSDAFERSGTGVWRAPGLLILQGDASGQRKEYTVRAGVLHACAKHGLSYHETPCEQC